MAGDYDAIVIGSGLGALTVASVLAQLSDRKVLVLERHFKIGGFTHTFKRQNFTWDVGLHYVGGMNEGSRYRKIFDFVTRSGVRWKKMPYYFEKFVYPDFTFAVPSDSAEYQGKLIAQFPDEKEAIAQYFRDIAECHDWIEKELAICLAPQPVSWLLMQSYKGLRNKVLTTTKDYMDDRFKDKKLKALLTSQWGDYGLPPGESALLHSLIVAHYLKGGFYPEGGSKSIADAIVPIIQEKGGQCLPNHEVKEILLEGNKAVGVRVLANLGKEKRELVFKAPLIISDAGLCTTFGKLLPEKLQPPQYQKLDKKALSCVTLYIGLKESAEALNFHGENHWIFAGYDHDSTAKKSTELLDCKPQFAYLSFPSLKETGATSHTAEIISFVDYDSFLQWEGSSWKHRGAAYEKLKQEISESLLIMIERHYPGFKQLCAFSELSTPLTVASFTGHHRGSIYNIPLTPRNLRLRGFGPKTAIKNLLLTGADTVSLGIAGALMSGIVTGGYVLGLPTMMKLLKGKVPLDSQRDHLRRPVDWHTYSTQ